MRIPLKLPATPADIGEAYAKLDGALDCGGTTRLMGAVSHARKLENNLRCINLDSPGVTEKLNRLAGRIDALDESEAALFTGALDAESVSGSKKPQAAPRRNCVLGWPVVWVLVD